VLYCTIGVCIVWIIIAVIDRRRQKKLDKEYEMRTAKPIDMRRDVYRSRNNLPSTKKTSTGNYKDTYNNYNRSSNDISSASSYTPPSSSSSDYSSSSSSSSSSSDYGSYGSSDAGFSGGGATDNW